MRTVTVLLPVIYWVNQLSHLADAALNPEAVAGLHLSAILKGMIKNNRWT